MNSFENVVLNGDCLEILKTIPDESVDSYISDVPYGLGSHEPTPESILKYLQGEVLKTGDFKGADWDIPSVKVWEEIYRVLKPGSYLISFGGTRTFDLISLGIRMAGFVFRDSIADNYVVDLPNLQWVTSQGMPKSANVSHNIDKSLGHKRKATSKPISEEAKKFAHLGTGLKPCWEPILIFRKPLKGTIASNVLTYGVGAMNITGTRVKHASEEDFLNHKSQVEKVKSKGGVRDNSWKNSSDLSGANDVVEEGRWPTNVVFTHHPECVNTVTETKHVVWECVEDCPVKILDNQSGVRPSTLTGRADPSKAHDHPGTEMNPNSTFLGERTHLSKVYADTGGASRFYSQFEGAPFLYVPKANRREAGVGVFEVQHPTVKPLGLMRYLVRLVTPKGGVVLDSYCGSGSTLHAAVLEGCSYIGVERDLDNYAEAKKRLEIVHSDLAMQSEFLGI